MKDVLNEKLKCFHCGNLAQAGEFFGCHKCRRNGENGFIFRVWIRHALKVSLIGSWNGWNPLPMERKNNEYFEVFSKDAKPFDRYLYQIIDKKGILHEKIDPFARFFENPTLGKKNASVVYPQTHYRWKDASYIANLPNKNKIEKPLNVYEVNALSWKRHKDGSYFTFLELIKTLVPYVKKMGYTHVEFMPLNEFPFDGSWGYQTIGYFAITARLGTPDNFKRLVDAFHREGIGVLLDWVPAHFPKDDFGLFEFDGEPLFESDEPTKMEHPVWKTRMFDFSKGEVVSFLISSAVYLLKEFHLDGLRVDAVSSILYLDYDRKDGEWKKNKKGGNIHLEGVSFLKKLTKTVEKLIPHALMIAEESSVYPHVTKKRGVRGLGFDYKWNLGWMHDTLHYAQTDPYFRRYHHNNLTFSMMYSYSERFILPLSHDEVAQGKGSLFAKMFGDFNEKWANLRLLLAFMMAHPGKKLHFMGEELLQKEEWNYNHSLSWDTMNRKHQRFCRDLNELYLRYPALYERETGWSGFTWLEPDDCLNNLLAFTRIDKNRRQIVAIFNFSGIELKRYRLGVEKGEYTLILSTNFAKYGGNQRSTKKNFKSEKIPSQRMKHSILFDIPALTCVYLIKKT